MKSQLFKTLGVLLTLSIVPALSIAVASAQTYPTKPIRFIINFASGGSADIVGRMIATKLSDHLGKRVVVENHGGGGGIIGAEVVAKSSPDGYTLLFITSSHASNPAFYKLPYDNDKSFVPVARLGGGPHVLTVHPGVPVNSAKELIELAKKQPGKLICVTAGAGTNNHLAAEHFKSMAGIDFKMVHFKGSGPALIDLIGGHSQISLGSLTTSLSHIKSGKLKALGVSGKKRSPILRDVPTIADSGLHGYEWSIWFGILAPAGTPEAILDRLYKELSVIMALAETKKMFEDQGMEADVMNSAEFRPFIAEETAKYVRIVKEANIKLE